MSAAPSPEAYIDFLQALTPERTGELRDYCAPDIRFRDPFNDVRGVEAYKRVLDDMYEKLAYVRFKVRHSAGDDAIRYLRWDLEYRSGAKADIRTIQGMSELRFGADGRVVEHVDHWDAASQLYERLPLIGAVLRAIRRRIAA